MKTTSIIATTSALLFSGMGSAAEIHVLSTQATQEAYLELVAQFEKASGHKVKSVFTGTLNVQKRLAEGEAYDLIIMAGPAIDEQIKLGKALAGSRVDIAQSGTGLAVRKGAAKPDISSVDALKKTLLAVKSIGYSTGPSGLYMLSVFEKLGIADQVKGKLKQTPSGVFVGSLIAGGEAEVGFQQISELVHFAGIDYVGPLPGELQRMTVFSAGLHANAKQADAARTLVAFITAPAAAPVIRKHGLEPAPALAQQAGGDVRETQLSDTQQHGRQVFAQSCGVCHLQPSLGVKTYGPVLNKAAAAGNDDVMRAFIVNGTDRMPAFRHYLKPAEIDAIIAYLRTVPVTAASARSEQKPGDAR
jgi:molybdate transport system substrate-binding protein